MDAGARLSIDVWHTSVAAVVRTGHGLVVPLTFDGSPVLPFGVAVTEAGLHTGRRGADIGVQFPQMYVRRPGQRLLERNVTVGGVAVDPVDLVSAVLSRVGEQARQVTGSVPAEVVVCRPAHWGPSQVLGVVAAAGRAGMAAPDRLESAEAIVRGQMAAGVPVPVGAVVAVCRVDDTVGEVVLLRRTPAGFGLLAAMPLGEIGQTPGVTLPDQAAHALAEGLDANQLGGDRIGAVFCHTPEDLFPAVAARLTVAAGLVVEPVRVDNLAAAVGGLQATVPARPVRRRWRWARLVGSVGGVAAGWGGAAALVYELFSTGFVYAATSTSPKLLVTQWGAWGLAAVFALLGLVSAAVALSDLRALRADSSELADGPDRRLGSAVVFATAFGLGAAAVLGLTGGARFGVPPSTMLAWTLGSTVGLAALTAVLGVLAGRVPIDRGWPDRLRFPVEAAITTAVSTVAVLGAYVGVPLHDQTSWWWMEHAGAVGMGLTVAWLVVAAPWSLQPAAMGRWARLAAVTLLFGVPATVAISLDTFDAIAAFLIAAITLWWLIRLVQVAVPIVSTLIKTQTPPPPPPPPPTAAPPPTAQPPA